MAPPASELRVCMAISRSSRARLLPLEVCPKNNGKLPAARSTWRWSIGQPLLTQRGSCGLRWPAGLARGWQYWKEQQQQPYDGVQVTGQCELRSTPGAAHDSIEYSGDRLQLPTAARRRRRRI
jgi:hypothetical protein